MTIIPYIKVNRYEQSADDLVWGIFFENTNPIKRLEIKERLLVAVNEHAELQIEINLDALTDIKMIVLQHR